MERRDAPLIRRARPDDVPALIALELDASERFRDLGMHSVADEDPWTEAELLPYIAEGHAWVAGHDPLGYLLIDLIDGAAHIEQVSVRRESAGCGLGRSLVDTAAIWARSHGLARLTLTTFDAVPFNRPYYERLGFRVLSDDELSDGLRAVRGHEAARGLDRWPRVCMCRPVTSETVGGVK